MEIAFLALLAAIVFWPFTLVGIAVYTPIVGVYYLIKTAVRNGVHGS